MNDWRRRFGSIGDSRLLALALLLTCLGIAMIYSAGRVDVPTAVTGVWKKQLVWFCASLVAFALVNRIPLRWLEWAAPWIYGLSILLLITVLFVGGGPNTRSWLRVLGFNLQPAELAKLATVLMMARTLTALDRPIERMSQLASPVLIVLVPFALVMLQPDLGSALIFGVILVAALYWAGVSLAAILMLVSPAASLLFGFSPRVWGVWFIGLVVFLYFYRPYIVETVAVLAANIATGVLTQPLWSGLAEYQRKRLLVFLNPGVDPQGAGWHLIQSQVAIGSGGWFGQGFAQGPQKRLAFLPEQHTDFIFSVVGEELGFLGVIVFLVLFGWFLWRVIQVAKVTPNSFGGLIVFCLFAVWFAHLFINVGMTVGIMPITGLPLPLLSYGGSFLISVYMGLAIIERTAAAK
jgi:rod shape determining protein RodA